MAYTGQPVPSTTYQQAYFKVGDGQSVRVLVPESSDLKAGQVAYLDGFLGFVMQDVKTAAGETAYGILNIENAEFETDQIDATKTFAKGDRVYWNAATSKLTTDATTVFAGVVTAAKDDNNVIWFKLWSGFVADTSLEVIGDLTELDTTDKTSLVDAVNEVNTAVGTVDTKATAALARVAANVTLAVDADATAVRTAVIALLTALETAGLMAEAEQQG